MDQKPNVLTRIHDYMAREIYYMVCDRNFGLTVRELLVIFVIIGVLVAIAIPVIIGKRQNVGMNASAGNAANLALAMFNYSTDNGAYPYGKTSTEAFMSLFPAYLQDPANLFLNKNGGHKPFTGASITDLSKENICWTITMNNESGLTGSDPTDLPVLLSDLGIDYPKFPAGETKVTLTNNNVYGNDGVVVARLDNSTVFLRPSLTNQVTLTSAKFQPAPGANYHSAPP